MELKPLQRNTLAKDHLGGLLVPTLHLKGPGSWASADRHTAVSAGTACGLQAALPAAILPDLCSELAPWQPFTQCTAQQLARFAAPQKAQPDSQWEGPPQHKATLLTQADSTSRKPLLNRVPLMLKTPDLHNCPCTVPLFSTIRPPKGETSPLHTSGLRFPVP